jgi:hypothetical protein
MASSGDYVVCGNYINNNGSAVSSIDTSANGITAIGLVSRNVNANRVDSYS